MATGGRPATAPARARGRRLHDANGIRTDDGSAKDRAEPPGRTRCLSAKRFGVCCCGPKRRRSRRCVILFAVFSFLSPDLFPTKLTYISVMAVAAELGIVSIGVTLADDWRALRSVGRRGSRACLLCRDRADARRAICPPILAAPAAIAVGARSAQSMVRWSSRFRIHSFVVTLGTMLIWRGVVIALTGGFPITVDDSAAVSRRHVWSAAVRVPDVDAVVFRDRRGSARSC